MHGCVGGGQYLCLVDEYIEIDRSMKVGEGRFYRSSRDFSLLFA